MCTKPISDYYRWNTCNDNVSTIDKNPSSDGLAKSSNTLPNIIEKHGMISPPKIANRIPNRVIILSLVFANFHKEKKDTLVCNFCSDLTESAFISVISISTLEALSMTTEDFVIAVSLSSTLQSAVTHQRLAGQSYYTH